MPELPAEGGEIVSVTGEELHHLVRVVRVRTGEAVEAFDSSGRCAVTKLLGSTKEEAQLEILEFVPSRESRSRLVVGAALIQPEKFELILQKCTELGAAAFLPIIAARTELAAERAATKRERWSRILLEAVKQSGRSLIPTISEPLRFVEVLSRPNLVIFEAEQQPDSGGIAADATLLIGPEGGWSEEEISGARSAGARFRRLGPRRLRAETAAITALALAQGELGELA